MVDANCVKLTSYLGERRRTADAFAGDALLDLYASHQLAASILLRAAEGTGLRHHLRTDISLSLSEDLPVTVTAVDTRPNIDAVLDQTLEITAGGLVTAEPALLLQDEAGVANVAAPAGEAVELTVYLSRQDRVFAVPAFEVICELLQRRGFDGATALLGLDGTAHGRRQRSQFFSRNGDVPMTVIAVGSAALVSSVLPELAGLLRHPLVTLERVRLCKRDGHFISRPGGPPAGDRGAAAQWQKLIVYTFDDAPRGEPTHRAIVQRLRSAGIGGATVQRGVWGFHGDQAPHGDRLLQRVRHVPVITTVIDTAGNISPAFEIIDALTGEHGLVTCEDILAIRDGASLP